MTVNVLGTEYEIIKEQNLDNPKLTGGGYVECYSKKIVLRDKFDETNTVECVNNFQQKVLRHELVHAFFFESGNEDYSDDEELVNCLAILIPKMAEAMLKGDCL